MVAHTSRSFETELRTLRERLLVMGGRAEQQIADALTALAERDSPKAQKVIDRDVEIDKDELDIDELAQTILATRQPVASDLRFITMAMKFVTDLERIGDLAANIAKRAIELNQQAALPGIDFFPLAERVKQNLRDALDSLVSKDVAKAEKVIKADREIDEINAQIFKRLISHVAKEPNTVTQVIPLTNVARAFERIGDHSKNLAEQVMFMVRGRDVRHWAARADDEA